MPSSQWTLPEQFDEYRLVRMLGRGSMGVVFLGHDLVLDRPVAIKFLNVVDANARARDRFLTEARAAARIQHPNVMAVYRVGELEGRLYIIGEYIRGHSLSELPRPAPAKDLLKIGIDLARGLACAHRMGVLHRDVKLANAMLSESGEVKLLDFSLAKLLEATTDDGASMVAPIVSLYDQPTLEPDNQSMPRVTIDAGARGGRPIDASLTASPARSPRVDLSPPSPVPEPPPSPLDNTHSRIGVTAAAAQRVRIDQSSDTSVVGTPFYMAPELWRGGPSSRATDVYACGVLLYILASGTPPLTGTTALELARLAQEIVPKPLRAVAPWVDERFAAIVDRCLRPPTERYASGDELCSAFEALALMGSGTDAVGGNPYRGLQAFEARHRSVFFGRGAEIRAVVDRLHGESFVLVAGDSGVGKSSLSRAGVLPVFGEQARDGRAWTTLSLMPGRRPLQTLVSALASKLEWSEPTLREQIEAEPGELVRRIAKQQGKNHGLIVFIDQLEELVTLADRHQLAAVGRFLAALAEGPAGIRLLATARGDFLTRVAALPHIGPRINAAIYLLTPLTDSGLREAIVGPAALQDVHFDSDALIEELVVAGAEGSLPLMQFALAELWDARDKATRKITMMDLERIGRVTGALARHADNVVDALPAAQRVAVRRLLMRLVTIEDTRASLPREELVVGDQSQEAALEALVHGRLVVVREAQDGTVYEIAHEALIRNWGTLQRWIADERESREIRNRLELAALEWQRLGNGRVGLWGADQLSEGASLEPGTLRPRELTFVAAGQAQVRRARRLRLLALGSVPALIVLVFIGFRVQQARELAHKVDEQFARAQASLAEARALQEDTERLRQQSFAEFDTAKREAGELSWAKSRTAAADADRKFRGAIQAFDAALSLDQDNASGRERLADVILERALAAEHDGKRELAAELVERLPAGGKQYTHWFAPGALSLRTTPSVSVSIAESVRDPSSLRYTLGPSRALGETPLGPLEMAQGSYQLSLQLTDDLTIAYPLMIGRSEALELELALPGPESIPEDFIYIPEGRFLFGSPDDEMVRRFFTTAPLHEVRTAAFMIARHETTYAQWLEFLNGLAPDQHSKYLPGNDGMFLGAGINLSASKGGGWSLSISAGERTYTAAEGQPIVYAARTLNASQDWSRMPVSGLNVADVTAYIAWLAASGKVPGARLCSDWEWERAMRGADSRRYPHGDRLEPMDANIDVTYKKVNEAMGPDTVGLHPGSRSPFGLDDGAGNVWEWVVSTMSAGEYVIRSSSYVYDDFSSLVVNRGLLQQEMHDTTTGLRVCATPKE